MKILKDLITLLLALKTCLSQGDNIISNSVQPQTTLIFNANNDLEIIKAQITTLLGSLEQQQKDNQQLQKDLREQKQQFQKDLGEQKQQFQKDLREQKQQLEKVLHEQKEQFNIQLQKHSKVNQELRAQLQHQEDAFFQKLQKQDVRIAQLLEQHKDTTRTQTDQHREKDDQTVQHDQPRELAELTKDNTTVANKHTNKRGDDPILEPIVSHMTQQITEMTAEIQSLKNVNAQQDIHIAAAGIIGGSPYNAAGGPGNHLCLTSQPQYDNHPLPTVYAHAGIFGSEYDICPEPECNLTPACAACKISRTSSIMISGTNFCPSGWTTEYTGHIMSGYQGYSGSSEYLCVDSSLGNDHSSQVNNDQNVLYYVVSKCGALLCPPYVDEKIVTCAMCSK